jgi:nitronate monooxygenase
MNAFLKRFGLTHPIVQAPMAGITTPALAAAVSNGGGLGSLGCADLTPEQVRDSVQELRGRTNRGFMVNFFVHQEPDLASYDPAPMRARLAPYYKELGLGEVPAPAPPYSPLNAPMLALLLEIKPPIVSFHFGLPDKAALEALRKGGSLILASATTVAEARHLEAQGVDAIIAQSWEAGGHRGVFLGSLDSPGAGTTALVSQITAAIKLPVIAAGGIMNGNGIASVLKLGASAAQMGTAFMLCPEARTNAVHRRAITEARDDGTCVTRLFSGRPARVLANRFVRENQSADRDAAPFPTQHALTKPLRQPSIDKDIDDFLPLYAGQAASLARALPAEELMSTLIAEYEAALQ